jgi:2-dehydro-3-deoxyphosphogluconate aldolase/(4S)-4-hydroxy-2-oxoglutarate aldolase
MRSKSEIISLLENPGIIAVVRAKRADQIIPLSRALLAGGVAAIEVTMTTPDAIAGIQGACAHFGKQALIGVGTVLDVQTCKAALAAGAEFVVTPVLKPEFVSIAHAAGRPIMLGAYTPSEAQTAHEAGADFVKIFPADTLGSAYIKAIRAPLPHLRIVPTGGIDIHNIAEFLKAGCAALGVGGALVSSKILQEDNWTELENKATLFAEAARAAKG